VPRFSSGPAISRLTLALARMIATGCAVASYGQALTHGRTPYVELAAVEASNGVQFTEE
jgi:hypothetical protein